MTMPTSYSKLVDWEASDPSAPPTMPMPPQSSCSSSSYGSASTGDAAGLRAEERSVGAQMMSLGNRIVNSSNGDITSSHTSFSTGPTLSTTAPPIPTGLYSVPTDDADSLTCRICLDSDVRNNLIAPCACAGTSRWVHRNCLDQWRATREDVAFKQCTECKKPYVLMSRTRESFKSNCQRYSRFSILFCQDMMAPLLLTSIWITLISLLVFGFDSRSHKLIEAFKFTSRPTLFYFLSGLAVTFSIVGIIAMAMLCTGNSSSSCGGAECRGCEDCCYICCSRSHVAPIWVGPADSCAACCNGCSCDGCASGLACSGDCCAASALGEEAIAIVLVLFVVLAAVGLLASIFFGIWYTNQILQRHLHIISKKTMTKDLIVKDLAEGAVNPITEFEMHEMLPQGSERGDNVEPVEVHIMNRV